MRMLRSVVRPRRAGLKYAAYGVVVAMMLCLHGSQSLAADELYGFLMSTIHYSALRLRCATLRANGTGGEQTEKPVRAEPCDRLRTGYAAPAAESKHRQTMATDHAESVLLSKTPAFSSE